MTGYLIQFLVFFVFRCDEWSMGDSVYIFKYSGSYQLYKVKYFNLFESVGQRSGRPYLCKLFIFSC